MVKFGRRRRRRGSGGFSQTLYYRVASTGFATFRFHSFSWLGAHFRESGLHGDEVRLTRVLASTLIYIYIYIYI